MLVGSELSSEESSFGSNPVVICGFGNVGKSVAEFLKSPSLVDELDYVAFDLDPRQVISGSKVRTAPPLHPLLTSLHLSTSFSLVETPRK